MRVERKHQKIFIFLWPRGVKNTASRFSLPGSRVFGNPDHLFLFIQMLTVILRHAMGGLNQHLMDRRLFDIAAKNAKVRAVASIRQGSAPTNEILPVGVNWWREFQNCSAWLPWQTQMRSDSVWWWCVTEPELQHWANHYVEHPAADLLGVCGVVRDPCVP